MLSKTPAFVLALALTIGTLAHAQGRDQTALAKELDRAAAKLLREASGSEDAFTGTARKFVESLDEFAATARRYAERPEPDRRDDKTLKKLSTLADQVSSALLDANMPPNIAQMWEDTRQVLGDLRGQGDEPSRTEAAYRKAGTDEVREVSNPAADLQLAVRDLHQAAEDLEGVIGDLRELDPADRQQMLFKARHIKENAQTAVDLAETAGAKDPRLGKALDKVEQYSDQLDQSVTKLEDPMILKQPHEAFFKALDGARAALKAAQAVKPKKKAPAKKKPKGKAKS